MKQHLRNIVLTAGLSVLLGSSTLSAQTQTAVANIPFAYHVGQQTFSAGKYTHPARAFENACQARPRKLTGDGFSRITNRLEWERMGSEAS